jgi:polyisoprenoid-binding protein YceI
MQRPFALAMLPAWLLIGAAMAQESPLPDTALPPLIERADPMMFLIQPDESEIAFDARATLHAFTGVSRRIDGRIEAIPVAIEQSGSGVITVRAESFTTGNRLRDRNMRALLEIDRYPDIRFTVEQVRVRRPPSADHASALLTVTGQLQVRDVTRPLQLPVEVALGADSATITGRFPLTFTDVGLTPPSFLFVNVDNQLIVRFTLVARLATSPAPVSPPAPAS